MDNAEWSKRAAALANAARALPARVRSLETMTDLTLWERNAAHLVIALSPIQTEATLLEASEVHAAAESLATCITVNVPYVRLNLLGIPRAFQAAEPHLIALFTASVALERAAIDGRRVSPAVAKAEVGNGPQSDSTLRYGGKVANLQPKAHALLAVCWSHRKIMEGTAAEVAWNDSAASANAVKQAVKRVNAALSEVGCPLSLSQRAGWLELS